MKNKMPETKNDAFELLSKFAPLPPFNLCFECRNVILETSLLIEKTTSLFLAFLIGIPKANESLALENKNSAFLFKQKIDLLVDIGVNAGRL